MAELFSTKRLVNLFNKSVERWHVTPTIHDEREKFFRAAQLIHSNNFELWHEEDKARDPRASDRNIARVKRAIDRLNQHRNDAIQALDELVAQRLKTAKTKPSPAAALHSETVGSIVDRLSILALKVFHMREETQRGGASPEHRASCAARLAVLEEQQQDLAGALKELQQALVAGKRRFKVYYQMKMYNDPSLNPVLYQGRGRKSG